MKDNYKALRYENKCTWGTDIKYILDDGTGTIDIGIDNYNKYCYINDLIVHDDFRNRGRGSYFLRLAEEEISTQKYPIAVLKVIKGSLAEQWYRRCGYKDSVFSDEVEYIYLQKRIE